jgi:hypothetical protein
MEIIDLAELCTQRMVVLIEDENTPNQYRQVIFTPEKFKAVSDAIFSQFKRAAIEMRKNYEAAEIELSEETYALPEEIRDFTSPSKE